MSTLFHRFKSWAPFRIDALGIVTILGADQTDLVVGRLARTGFTGLLPLLGAFRVADNSIVKPIPGFVLYNVSDGILANDITGWFARWLLCQDLTFTSSTLHISVEDNVSSRACDCLSELAAAGMTMGTLLIILILSSDWWGLANWAAMACSVIVRRLIIGQNLSSLDTASSKAVITSSELVKVFLTLPTGNAVTIKAPQGNHSRLSADVASSLQPTTVQRCPSNRLGCFRDPRRLSGDDFAIKSVVGCHCLVGIDDTSSATSWRQ